MISSHTLFSANAETMTNNEKSLLNRVVSYIGKQVKLGKKVCNCAKIIP